MDAITKISTRLTREQWLQQTLDVLAAQGPGKLSIEHLCSALGVSRGSFYWHFKNRSDFVHALLGYWHDTHTSLVPELIEAGGGSARDKFRRFVLLVLEKKLTRFDPPIRLWAAQDPAVDELVTRTDQFRMNFVRGLFADMGFTAKEIEIRARGCLAYLIMEGRLFNPAGELNIEQNLDELCAFFTQKQ